MENDTQMTIRILGKDFHIACKPEEQSALLASAEYLDGKMRQIRQQGKLLGSDRITVMAALNISHELLQSKTHPKDNEQALGARIRRLRKRVESSLQDPES